MNNFTVKIVIASQQKFAVSMLPKKLNGYNNNMQVYIMYITITNMYTMCIVHAL